MKLFERKLNLVKSNFALTINYFLLVLLLMSFSVVIGVLEFADWLSLSFVISGVSYVIDSFCVRILPTRTGCKYLVNILLAVMLISLLYFLFPYGILLIILKIISVLQIIIPLLVNSKVLRICDFIETNIFDFLLFFFCVIVFCYFTDYAHHLSVYTPGPTDSDHVFFTSLVVSLAHGNYFESFFNQGTSVNYQFFAFLFPSFIFKYTGLTANQSLYGVFMPFIETIGFFLLTSLISPKNNWKFKYCALFIIYVGLQSINPVNLIKLNFQGFNFLTSGYFLPGGNPPLTFGFVVLLCGFGILDFNFYKLSKRNTLLFAMISSVLMLTKIALWLPFFIFYSLLVVFNMPFKLVYYLKYGSVLLFMFLAEYLIYSFTYGNNHPYKLVLNNGEELFRYVNGLLNFNGTLGFVSCLVVIIALNFGPRLMVILGAMKSDKNTRNMFLSALVTIAMMYVMYGFVGIDIMDGGVKVGDQSFDIEQFIRSSFIIFHIVVIFTVFRLVVRDNIQRSILYGTIFTSSIIGLCGYFALFYNTQYLDKRFDKSINWRKSIRCLELGTNNTICFIGENKDYSAWDICSDDVGRWWFISSKRYVTSSENTYRNRIVERIYKNPEFIRRVIKEGVNMFILTPEAVNNLRLLDQLKLVGFERKNQNDFVYVLSSK
jgi:hypothetical protein